MIDNTFVLSADIGGTHITAALVDTERGHIVRGSLVREAVDSHANAGTIADAWSKAIARAVKGSGARNLSLAMPGPFDYEQGISLIKGQGKYEQLYGLNVKELLGARLGLRAEDIFLINDAAAFLQGEVLAGAARGYSTAIGITLGTGLGTCIYRDGVADNADLWKAPFKEGIAEDYLCTRWFIRYCQELSGKNITGVSDLLSNGEEPGLVQEVFGTFGENLGLFLASFVAAELPEVVVLGGNIARAFDRFEHGLSRVLKQHYPDLPVKTAHLGEEAALLGAAGYLVARSRMASCLQQVPAKI